MARGGARGPRLRDGGLQALLPGGVLVLQRLQRAGRLLRARRARGQQAGRALAARGARQRWVLGRRRRRRAARRRARRRRGARRRRACARALAIAGRCANGRGCAVRATKLWDVRAALVRATGGGSSIGLSGARRARRCSPPAGGKPLLLNLWRLFGDVSRSAQPIPGMSTHRGRGRSRGASACAPKPAAVRGMRAKSSYTRTCAGSRCPPRGCSDSGSARGKRAAPLTTAASKNGCPAALALARACARENALARAHATSSSFFASHGRRAASASASAGELASASVSGARVEPAAQRLASARGCPRLPGPTARGRAGCFYAGAGGAGAAAGAPGRRAAGARRSRGWPCRSRPSR